MELRLTDPDQASLFEILNPEPPKLATAQARGVQQHRCDSSDFRVQRGVIAGTKGVCGGQHPTDLIWFYDDGSYVRPQTGKSVWTGDEGACVQTSAKLAEPVNNLFRLAAGV